MSLGPGQIDPRDTFIEYYKGRNLYLHADTPTYYFFYGPVLYDDFNSQAEAEIKINELVAIGQGEASPVDVEQPEGSTKTPGRVYRGVPIYSGSYSYSGGSGSYEYFYYKGETYSDLIGSAHYIGNINNKIDELLSEAGPTPQTPYEPPPTPAPPTPPTEETPVTAPTGFSWLWGWIENLKIWYGNLVNGFKLGLDNVSGALTQGIGTTNTRLGEQVVNQLKSNEALGKIGSDVSGALLGGLQGVGSALNEPLQNATKSALDQALESTSTHSPDPEVKARLEALIAQLQGNQKAIIEKIQHSQIDPGGAQDAANTLIVELVGAQLAVKTTALLIDLLHPIKNIEALEVVGPMVDSILSGASINEIMNMHVRASIIPALQKHVNSLYTPALPGHQDLINMLVKEKITREQFNENFAYMGYNTSWAEKIWDAHFNAPGLSDILTSWRRGEISESRVDELMILVDLDPAYKQVFDTRKYVDPSLSLARFMFETGSIDASRVADIVHRSGFNDSDSANITDWIVKNQERRFRYRYLTTLATGYARGVVDKAELSSSVLSAGYTQGTADWIQKSADIRKEIAGRSGRSAGPKLLSLGDLKKAYANNLYTEDQLRTELQVRQYQTGDIETLIDVMNLDKSEVETGKKVVALSISEMINAFRYGVWTEDHLRIELQLRGLSTDEVNTLIDTKKAQWGVAAQQGP